MSLRSTLHRAGVIVALAATVTALSACSAGGDQSADNSSPNATSGSQLQTVTPGKLTIATGDPDYSPWFVDNDPSNGKGFEGAVANAVAKKLGYTGDKIVWTRSSFESAIAPGPKDWDMNIQQFSVTDQRKKAVDFSSPYYTTAQAVVTVKGSPAAKATTLAELSKVKVGASVGSTSYTVAKKDLGTKNLSVFNSNEDLVSALTSGQIDALVIDVPSAFYLTGAKLKNGVIVGQFADTSGGDKLAFVLPKDSALTPAVSKAVDALKADGTLEAITKKWLSDTVNVPVLK